MNHFMTFSSSGDRVCILNPLEEPLRPFDALYVSPKDSIISTPSDAIPTAKHSRLHQCSDCGKVFTTAGHRSRHFKIHSDQKSHHCPFPDCTMSCRRHDNLVQHFRIHLPKAERKRDAGYVRSALAEMVSSAAESDIALPPWTTPPSDLCSSPMSVSSPSRYSLLLPSPTVADEMSIMTSPPFSSGHSASASLACVSEAESKEHAGPYKVSFVRGE